MATVVRDPSLRTVLTEDPSPAVTAAPPTLLPEGPTLRFLARELQDRTQELERTRAGRQAILRLSAALLHQRSVADLGACLLNEAASLLAADTGSVMLLDTSGQNFDIIADLGLPQDTQRAGIPVVRSVGGTVLQVGAPLILRGSVAQRSPNQRLLSCSIVVPISLGDRPAGVVNLSRRRGEQFDDADLELMSTVAATFAAALESLRLQAQQRAQMASTIKALALAIEAKDPYTRGHCERLSQYARRVALQLGLPSHEVDDIEMGATLHDIGKIGVPEQVLTKPGRLTEDEYEQIKLHPTRGSEIIAPVGLSRTTQDAVLHHHERWDGKGYPAGLAGEGIPLAARIIAVVDTFDAMTISRPYRGARTVAEAVGELERCSGSQFDPKVVEAFLEVVRQEGLASRLLSIETARTNRPPEQVATIAATA